MHHHAMVKKDTGLSQAMELVTKKNLVDTILSSELRKKADTSEASQAKVSQLIEAIKKSEHPEMHRMLDMTAGLVQSTLSTAVLVAE